MENIERADLTRLLRRMGEGDRAALSELVPLVYRELHALARAHMAAERAGHTLQPTALVNETFLRISAKGGFRWRDRRHFFRAAATIMRTILVNHARDRKRVKRGGEMRRMPWDDEIAQYEERGLDLVELDEALEKLEALDPRQVEIIELRFFAGLSVRETADTIGLSERTVASDWSLARAWLMRELDAAS